MTQLDDKYSNSSEDGFSESDMMRTSWAAARDPGKSPGIEPHELSQFPSSHEQVNVICVDYSSEKVQVQDVQDIGDFLSRHRPDWSAVRWIRIEGLTDMAVIRAFAEKYELHPLAIEDVMHLGQRPKAEDYPASAEHPGRLFVVAQLVEMKDDQLQHEQISFFLGRKTLVTFHERCGTEFIPILQRIQTRDSRLRRSDVSFLLYCLLDAIVDHMFPMLERVSGRLEQLEDAVLVGKETRVLQEIHQLKQALTTLRRVVWPLRELIFNLHREAHECLSETTRTYLRDVYDHLVQVLDLLETHREFINSLTELHMSIVSNRLNDIMKTLTIINTIFVPLTFLAGVYGMNMTIPETNFSGFYVIFWGFSLVTAGGMLAWFWRRGWFQ